MTRVPVADLHLYPGNARRGNVDMISDSLKTHGQYKPIVVNRGGKAPELANTVIAGNHTLQAAKLLGWDTIDVHWIDVTADEARRIVLVDNRTQDKATYDVDALLDLLTESPDLDGTGFTRDDVDALLESLDEQETDDDVPDMPDEPEPAVWAVLVECDSEADARDLKTRLIAEGYQAGIA